MISRTALLFGYVSLLVQSVTVVASSSNISRQLEDQANSGFDVTQYSVQTGSCFRMKQVNNNDDDGNAYFYNGAYRAQYSRYTSFYLCGNGNGKGNSNKNNDNPSTSANCNLFVTDLPTYLETSINFLQTYCSTCQSSCRRQRKLNEGDGGDQQQNSYEASADCNTCSKQCKPMVSEGNDNANSASNYLQCQKSYNDGELQYYAAPQCGNPDYGQFAIIGQYYDEDCTIKLNNDEAGAKFGLSYSYGAFETVMASKINCSTNPQYCADLASSAVNCGTGESLDDDGSKLCRAAQQATAVYTYYKKPLSKRLHVKALLIVALVLTTVLGFLSYTYYIRHRRDPSTSSSDDNNNTKIDIDDGDDYKLASADGTPSSPVSRASDLPVIN